MPARAGLACNCSVTATPMAALAAGLEGHAGVGPQLDRAQ